MRPCPDHDILGCPMTRINKVSGKGRVPCSIMLIGEAPGKMEDAKGKPFIGKSGSELEHLYLAKCAEIDRRNVYITNLVKCRTNDRDRDPTEDEMTACGSLLLDELSEVNPQYVGLVGRLATQFFLKGAKMEKVHGFGYEGFGRLMMPLYHPAYGLHNTPMMRHIMEDFRRFGRMVRGDEGVMWRSNR